MGHLISPMSLIRCAARHNVAFLVPLIAPRGAAVLLQAPHRRCRIVTKSMPGLRTAARLGGRCRRSRRFRQRDVATRVVEVRQGHLPVACWANRTGGRSGCAVTGWHRLTCVAAARKHKGGHRAALNSRMMTCDDRSESIWVVAVLLREVTYQEQAQFPSFEAAH